MKPAKWLYTAFFLALLISARCPAQSVFQATLLAPLSGGLNEFSGRAYFEVDATGGQYQIDFINPSPPPDLTAIIGAPEDNLTIQLGVGTPQGWSNATGDMYPDPFIPLPPRTFGSPIATEGTQYNGTFQSSSALYATLLEHGEVHLIGEATGFGDGALQLVVVPEPGNAALFSCGRGLFLIPTLRNRYRRRMAGNA